jgi:hypothetical protein
MHLLNQVITPTYVTAATQECESLVVECWSVIDEIWPLKAKTYARNQKYVLLGVRGFEFASFRNIVVAKLASWTVAH